MNDTKRTFGEVFFEELNSDQYLKKIYEDILFNYAIAVFGFKSRRKRHSNISDALSFADLLSKSNHSKYADSQKMWAQEIITMLNYIYPNDERITYMAGSVLDSIGNYQGQSIIESSFDGVDALGRFSSDSGERFFRFQWSQTSNLWLHRKQSTIIFRRNIIATRDQHQWASPTSCEFLSSNRFCLDHRIISLLWFQQKRLLMKLGIK